ncbi:cupin domain-containing protein [Leifsonia xyli]|uniref:cupin domain-containing protein n=1 Tax=Leifsonia xyli TaxID=1575 RepID=UPI003D67DD05
MKAGDVVVLPAGGRHRIITAGGGRQRSIAEEPKGGFDLTTSDDGSDPVIDLFCGHYTIGPGAGSLLFGSLPTPTHVSLFGSEEGRSVLTRLSALMREEAEVAGSGSAAIMSAFCTVLMALVLRTSVANGAHDRLWTAASDPRMAAVVQRVVDDPGADWSVDELSRRTMTSRATFFRHFQAATGMTFGRFLARVRMMSASDLLLSSDLTVAAVGDASATDRRLPSRARSVPRSVRRRRDSVACTRSDHRGVTSGGRLSGGGACG